MSLAKIKLKITADLEENAEGRSYVIGHMPLENYLPKQ